MAHFRLRNIILTVLAVVLIIAGWLILRPKYATRVEISEEAAKEYDVYRIDLSLDKENTYTSEIDAIMALSSQSGEGTVVETTDEKYYSVECIPDGLSRILEKCADDSKITQITMIHSLKADSVAFDITYYSIDGKIVFARYDSLRGAAQLQVYSQADDSSFEDNGSGKYYVWKNISRGSYVPD